MRKTNIFLLILSFMIAITNLSLAQTPEQEIDSIVQNIKNSDYYHEPNFRNEPSLNDDIAISTSRTSPNTLYRLGPGDELKITIFHEDDLSGTYKIDGTGSISMPLIGNINISKLSLPELEENLINAYSQDILKNPKITVEVLNYRPFYIVGEVKNPGSYPFVEGMNIINAVALAGGFTYRAKENSMTITRTIANKQKKENLEPQNLVLPGDIIEIEERFF